MKKAIVAILTAGTIATFSGTGTFAAVDVNNVVIPEYTTVDYETEFVSTLDAIDDLKTPCEEQGTIVSMSYTAPTYAINEMLDKDETIDKTLQVYLPYGYDESKQYNILYLLHGTGGKDTYWFFDAEPDTTQNVLDNMIQQGLCEPLIVVTPEYPSELKGKENKIKDEMAEAYAKEHNDSFISVRNDLWTEFFGYELRNDIMPLVESEYSTYAGGDVSEESMIASRNHRALAGLSRGSMATLRAGLIMNRDEIGWFGNYSGAFTDFEKLQESFVNNEYHVNYWYNGTGTADFAAEDHLNFHNQVMENMQDEFTDGVNYAMVVKEEGAHDYANWITDLYNSLLVFFK